MKEPLYIYIAGINEITGKPVVLKSEVPVQDKCWILIQVVDMLGHYSKKQALEIGARVQKKSDAIKLAELTKKAG